jgi:hypothetical protein
LGVGRLKGRVGWTGLDPLPPAMTVSFLEIQFSTNKKHFLTNRKAPKGALKSADIFNQLI